MVGVIVKMKEDKGFCFIKGEDNLEYFLHKSEFNGHWIDLVDDIGRRRTVKVEFEPSEGAKGPRASNARRLDHPNQA